MVYITEQHADGGPMNDQPDIATHPDRPEVLILWLVEPMELHSRILRIQLKIKGCGFYKLLFLAGKFSQAIGKSIGDKEVHRVFF
jgi:hypothetical protein